MGGTGDSTNMMAKNGIGARDGDQHWLDSSGRIERRQRVVARLEES